MPRCYWCKLRDAGSDHLCEPCAESRGKREMAAVTVGLCAVTSLAEGRPVTSFRSFVEQFEAAHEDWIGRSSDPGLRASVVRDGAVAF